MLLPQILPDADVETNCLSKLHSSACEFQTVHAGTGQETFAIIERHWESVSCKTLTDRVAESWRHEVVPIAFFGLDVDNGPDCRGAVSIATKKIRSATEGVARLQDLKTWDDVAGSKGSAVETVIEIAAAMGTVVAAFGKYNR